MLEPEHVKFWGDVVGAQADDIAAAAERLVDDSVENMHDAWLQVLAERGLLTTVRAVKDPNPHYPEAA